MTAFSPINDSLSSDPEIVFQPWVPIPPPLTEMSMAGLFSHFQGNPQESGTLRWKKFKQFIPKQTPPDSLEKNQLLLSIRKGIWESEVCREQDQLWPETVSTGQQYSYIEATAGGITYFSIRRGLKGRVGELVTLNTGPLMKGSQGLDSCMRILDFIKIERVFLNNDAAILGEFRMELRIFQPVASRIPHDLYLDVGFVHWHNHPRIGYNGEELPFNATPYGEAVDKLRSTKLKILSQIDIASEEDVKRLKRFCKRYQLVFIKATVTTLGAAITDAMKASETKVQAQKDFRKYYEACFWASPSNKKQTKIYNRALDALIQHKFLIKYYK